MATRFPLFNGMSDDQLTVLDAFFERCAFNKEEVVFEQGDPARRLYVLCSGEVVIRYKPYDGPPLVVTRIAPGGVFGWSAALARPAYTSGAIATMPSIALRTGIEQLHSLCLVAPQTGTLLMERLSEAIAERRTMRNPVLDLLNKKFSSGDDCTSRSVPNGTEPEFHR